MSVVASRDDLRTLTFGGITITSVRVRSMLSASSSVASGGGSSSGFVRDDVTGWNAAAWHAEDYTQDNMALYGALSEGKTARRSPRRLQNAGVNAPAMNVSAGVYQEKVMLTLFDTQATL